MAEPHSPCEDRGAADAAPSARPHVHQPARGVPDERRPERGVGAPDRVDLVETAEDSEYLELYLRVWRLLYPEADVELAELSL